MNQTKSLKMYKLSVATNWGHYLAMIVKIYFLYRVYKRNATSEFPKKSTLQFLSIKEFI